MPKISVIIPVYNTEKYLPKCLDSVTNQTLKDIEIICINDCSTDNSLNVLREYAEKDKRIKIVDFPENKGAAAARNSGIDMAQGEYLGFVDSDDFVDLDFYEKLYTRAQSSGAEVVIGNIIQIIGTKIFPFNNFSRELIKYNKINFYCLYTIGIYEKKLIKDNNIKFSNHRQAEDYIFSILASYYTRKIEIIDNTHYNYIKRENSTSYKDFTGQFNDYILAIYEIIKRINELAYTKEEYQFLVLCFVDKIIDKFDFYKTFFKENERLKFLEIINIVNKKVSFDKSHIEIIKLIRENNIQKFLLYKKQQELFNTIKAKKQETDEKDFKQKHLTKENHNKIISLQNNYAGKRCFILGSSPSLKDLDLTKLNNEYTFTVNRGYMLKNYGLSHSSFHVISDIHTFKDHFSKSNILEHFTDQLFCYAGMEPPIKNINTYYFDYLSFNLVEKKIETNLLNPLIAYESVIHFAIQIALFMGFERIYILGVDLDYSKNIGHAYEETTEETKRQLGHSVTNAKTMLKGLNEIAKNLPKNVKIYNASPGGIVDCIPRVNYKELF